MMVFRWLIAGIMALVFGAVCLVIESTYYGHIDEDGVLVESCFLPLGFLLLALGVGLFVVGCIKTWNRKFRAADK